MSEDKSEAVAGYYRIMNQANDGHKRFMLAGLDAGRKYTVNGDDQRIFHGDELMYIGIAVNDYDLCSEGADFSSAVYYLKEV